MCKTNHSSYILESLAIQGLICVNNFAEVLEESLMGLKDGLSEDEFQKLIETLSHRKEKKSRNNNY